LAGEHVVGVLGVILDRAVDTLGAEFG
jgi:hypothetical protein